MAQFPSSSGADGIWTLKQNRRAELGGDWPLMPAVADYLIVAGGGGGGGADTSEGGSGNGS